MSRKLHVGWIALLAMIGSHQASAAPAREVTLASLKNGSQFEVVDAVSVPIPAALMLLGELPTFEIKEGRFSLAPAQGSPDPACRVSGLKVTPDSPPSFTLTKGAKITVQNVKMDKKPNGLPGTVVSFVARSAETSVAPRFQCFPGKSATGAMPIEIFEKIFRYKVRLIAQGPKGP